MTAEEMLKKHYKLLLEIFPEIYCSWEEVKKNGGYRVSINAMREYAEQEMESLQKELETLREETERWEDEYKKLEVENKELKAKIAELVKDTWS